jgi:hypothetical protein
MAQKAAKKEQITQTFWVYDPEGFNSGARHRLEELGILVERDDGSYAVTVERDKKSALEEFYALITQNGIAGPTKKKPEAQPAQRRRSEPGSRARGRSGKSSRDGHEQEIDMTAEETLRFLGYPNLDRVKALQGCPDS